MNPENRIWRFIPPLEASGCLQMALDRWLLEQHRLGLQPPVLRFYRWSPAAISLGFHQQRYPEHWRNLIWQAQPVALVRRPSGGRAVLHQGDLTYAVIASGFSGSRIQAYREICAFLVRGWQSLGVGLTYGEAGRGYIHSPNCFGTATGADLVTHSGLKLIGSAQLRRGQAILQHGSMRLNPDPDLFYRVFGTELAAFEPPPPEQVIAALSTAAQDCFDIQLQTKPLLQPEWEAVLESAWADSDSSSETSMFNPDKILYQPPDP